MVPQSYPLARSSSCGDVSVSLDAPTCSEYPVYMCLRIFRKGYSHAYCQSTSSLLSPPGFDISCLFDPRFYRPQWRWSILQQACALNRGVDREAKCVWIAASPPGGRAFSASTKVQRLVQRLTPLVHGMFCVARSSHEQSRIRETPAMPALRRYLMSRARQPRCTGSPVNCAKNRLIRSGGLSAAARDTV